MKPKFGLWVILISIFVLFAIWMQVKSGERAKKNFEAFNSSEINSKLKSVRIANKGSGIWLEDGRKFVLYPFTDKSLNNSNIFNHIAERGDSVIKPAYSDTLMLIKNNEILKYTFKKF